MTNTMLREVFSDFVHRERRSDGTVRIPLGAATEQTPDLLGLHDGEHVLLAMPGELQAEASVQGEPWQGTTYWYGILDSMKAIQDIYIPSHSTHQESQPHPQATSAS